MHPRVKELLIELAERKGRESEMWEEVYGKKPSSKETEQADRDRYHTLCEDNEQFQASIIPELIRLSHTVYTVMIAGDGRSSDRYRIEEELIEEFGSRILGDTEMGQFWIMTTPADEEEVFRRLVELTEDGEVERLENGHFGSYSLESYTPDNPHIAGFGSWTQAKKFLEWVRGEEELQKRIT